MKRPETLLVALHEECAIDRATVKRLIGDESYANLIKEGKLHGYEGE